MTKKVRRALGSRCSMLNSVYDSYAYKSTQVIDGSQVVCQASKGRKANAELDRDNERRASQSHHDKFGGFLAMAQDIDSKYKSRPCHVSSSY